MKVHYYFRNKQLGFSIQTVFTTLIYEVCKYYTIRESYLVTPFADIIAIIRNLIFAYKVQRLGEINHLTGDVHYLLYVLDKKRTIVTVHDIMYYRNLHGLKKYLWKLLYIYSLKKSAHVVFISEYSKKEVLDIINLPINKISVIPNPVSPNFYYTEKEFNCDCPLILHIGTNIRKNLHNTIRALNGIVCHLRIIGHLNEENINLLNEYKIQYSNVYDLDEKEIIREYQNADIINFPSLYEGFGMPIIEGQTTGRIVVTSNMSPMKEVAGNGAVLVDPLSIESIRDAYLKIINDKVFRLKIIEKGKVNATKYKVETIAEQYINLYKMIKSL